MAIALIGLLSYLRHADLDSQSNDTNVMITVSCLSAVLASIRWWDEFGMHVRVESLTCIDGPAISMVWDEEMHGV
jgi:hypothetical protein